MRLARNPMPPRHRVSESAFLQPTPSSDAGQALPLALIALAVGVILITIFVLAVSVHLRLTNSVATGLLDYYAADAGIERAIVPLITNPAAYPSSTPLNIEMNGRAVSISIAPIATQIITQPTPSGPVTTTITTYFVASSAADVQIEAAIEAHHISGQLTATLRVNAWKAGR